MVYQEFNILHDFLGYLLNRILKKCFWDSGNLAKIRIEYTYR